MENIKIEYFVKIKYYQYDSGASDNGFYYREEKNNNIDKIKALVVKLKDIESYRREYVEDVAYGGYVVEVGNICKREIKEEIVETTLQALRQEG